MYEQLIENYEAEGTFERDQIVPKQKHSLIQGFSTVPDLGQGLEPVTVLALCNLACALCCVDLLGDWLSELKSLYIIACSGRQSIEKGKKNM